MDQRVSASRTRRAGRAYRYRRPCRSAAAGQPTQDCFPAACAQTCGWLVRNGARPVHRRWKCWGFRSRAGTRRARLPGRARVIPVHTEKSS